MEHQAKTEEGSGKYVFIIIIITLLKKNQEKVCHQDRPEKSFNETLWPLQSSMFYHFEPNNDFAVRCIVGLQSFPRECEDKDMAAMLDDITKEANDKYFVNVLQHGGYDVT
jgi:hypothetical protein